jgi:hypothetical protein
MGVVGVEYRMEGNWRRPKSQSLEDFVWFVLKVLLVVALLVACYRYALTADPHEAPWKSLPLLGRL